MRKILIFAIRAYQMAISPYLPPSCRFHPTCSEYGREAVQKYGAVRGAWLSAKRLAKCHPFHPGGLDPLH
ncbi:MAG: membrane protein insertion efficiency factor YidD [Nitrospinae bacterium]|nr:membrane protein insertion efficiency factor YidD [Nitrospinota bacterium]